MYTIYRFLKSFAQKIKKLYYYPVINVRNLSKVFSKFIALENIQLDVEKGEIFGIIGMSGAGKTTLMRCLTFLERPTQGEIYLDGQLLTEKSCRALRQKMGMIFQHFHLLSSKTVEENVILALSGSKEAKRQRAHEMLSLVHLEHKADLFPSSLSGGEKQRVAIARALANDPKVLLCDEATSALDPKNTREILALLRHLNQKLGLTILLITHEMDVIRGICTQVAVMEKGHIIEQGNVIEIFSNPTQSITKSLLEHRTQHLPDIFKKPLYRLVFNGPSAKEPVISKMLRQHQVDVNILQGSIDYVQHTIIGSLTLELLGSAEEVLKALSFLRAHDILVQEVL